jgi:hypothetical protein
MCLPLFDIIKKYSPQHNSGTEDYQRVAMLEQRLGHCLEGKIAVAISRLSFVLGYPVEKGPMSFFRYLGEVRDERNRTNNNCVETEWA